MTVYFIYRQLTDERSGLITSIDLIECDGNEQSAASFAKLYNLQIPFDLRNKVSFHYAPGRVV
jgi:hypothetical protein